jgi:hypothetical protein
MPIVRIVLVTAAGIIDLFEIVVELAMTAIGSTGAGAVGGCAVGAYYAGQVGCTVGAALGGLLGFFAQTVGAGAVMGFMLGYVLTVMITFSFGAALVAALLLTGHFKWFPTMYVFGGKLLPFLGLAPGWLIYAWHCTGKDLVVKKRAEANVEKVKEAAVASARAMQDIFEPGTATQRI